MEQVIHEKVVSEPPRWGYSKRAVVVFNCLGGSRWGENRIKKTYM